jgi:hypothetical protein
MTRPHVSAQLFRLWDSSPRSSYLQNGDALAGRSPRRLPYVPKQDSFHLMAELVTDLSQNNLSTSEHFGQRGPPLRINTRSSATAQKTIARMDALHTALLARGFSPEDIQFPTSANDVRVVNLLVPVIPRVMVKPRSVQLVSAALKAAKEFDLKVQARSGGHSYGSYCLGGVDGHLVVDLLHFKEFHMDQTSWRATVGPAIILKDLCNLLHDSGGRAIPHGIRPTVGIGGWRPLACNRRISF